MTHTEVTQKSTTWLQPESVGARTVTSIDDAELFSEDDLADELRSFEFIPLIEELGRSTSGLGYVYWCLEYLADELDLDDAVLVSEHPSIGRQLFRLRHRPLGQLAGSPLLRRAGLYLCPQRLNQRDCAAVSALCQVAIYMELMRHDANHDPLTGLPNRRAYDAALTSFVSNSERQGIEFSVGLMDVDGLKAINDTLGHHEGDRLLQVTGAEIRRSMRAGDVAARLGGDEFGLLLVSPAPDAALHFRDRLQNAMSAVLGRPVRYSIGVAHAPDESTDPSRLFRLADARLYEDKRGASTPGNNG